MVIVGVLIAIGGNQRSEAQIGSPTAKSNLSVIYGFTGAADGGGPVIHAMDSAGNLYGTTGTWDIAFKGEFFGTIFKLSPQGKLTTLHSFSATDRFGYFPNAMILDSAGNLFVTTFTGGQHGSGVLFRMDTNNRFSILHVFGASGDVAGAPNALTMDAKGDIYGTAQGGTYHNGAVFNYDTSGKYKVIYNLNGTTDGNSPSTNLVLDGAGNLYFGTCCNGYAETGNLLKLDLATGNTTNLHIFTSVPDGALPRGLAMNPSGTLYGTTAAGGSIKGYCKNGPCGTIFEYTPSAGYRLLYTFTGGPDGAGPSPVTVDPAGMLYGTTRGGGSGNGPGDLGTIYKFTADGKKSVIYNFTGAVSGDTPTSIILGPHGRLYGATFAGGPFLPTVAAIYFTPPGGPWGPVGVVFSFTP